MTTFFNPSYLWMLFLIIPLLALYFLKSKPSRRRVGSLEIWRIVLSKIKPNSIFQRFQNSLFLLFQVLVIVTSVMGLARPAFFGAKGLNRIIIIDITASMSAHDVKPSRFHAAVERACELCRKHRGRIAVYALGDDLYPLLPSMEEPAAAVNIIEQLTPGHFAKPSQEKLLLLIRNLEVLAPDEIYILTDTMQIDPPHNFMRQTAIFVETFGESGDNIAIVDGQAEWSASDGTINASIVVRNYYFKTRTISVSVKDDASKAKISEVEIEPGKRLSINLPPLMTEKLVAEISSLHGNDCCRIDNFWYFCKPKIKPKVLVDAPKQSILHQLGRALPMIEFIGLAAEDRVDRRKSEIASDRISAVLRSSDNNDQVAQPCPSCIFVSGGNDFRAGEILPWKTEHQIFNYIDWENVPAEVIKPGELPGIPLLESLNGNIISMQTEKIDDMRIPRVAIGINIDHPAIANDIFIPILLFNILEFLLKDEFPRLSYPVGHPGLYSIYKGSPPLVAGLHDVPGSTDSKVAVNIQHGRIEEFAPALPRLPGSPEMSMLESKQREGSPWRVLISCALFIVIAEWLVFMRRS